jgi:glycerophosphoryl diester phosphodiesterase
MQNKQEYTEGTANSVPAAKRKKHIFRKFVVMVAAVAATVFAMDKGGFWTGLVAADTGMEYSSEEVNARLVSNLLNRSNKNLNLLPIFAHRGFQEHALENTFAAYDAALAAYCPQIELDVRLSTDNVFYVVHDDTLKSVAGLDKKVEEMSSEELDQVILKNGEKLHRLSEVFDRYRNQVIYLVEFKDNFTDPAPFIDLLSEYPQYAFNVYIQSFNLDPLIAINEYFPNMFKQLLLSSASQIDSAIELDYIDSLALEQSQITKERVDKIHESGKEVWGWTITSTDAAKKLFAMGVDVVVSDSSAAVQTAKDEKAAREALKEQAD